MENCSCWVIGCQGSARLDWQCRRRAAGSARLGGSAGPHHCAGRRVKPVNTKDVSFHEGPWRRATARGWHLGGWIGARDAVPVGVGAAFQPRTLRTLNTLKGAEASTATATTLMGISAHASLRRDAHQCSCTIREIRPIRLIRPPALADSSLARRCCGRRAMTGRAGAARSAGCRRGGSSSSPPACRCAGALRTSPAVLPRRGSSP